MPVGRRLQRIPADEHCARPLGAVELQQPIGEAKNGAGGPAAIAQDIFRQRVVGAMRERIAVDDQKRPTLAEGVPLSPVSLNGFHKLFSLIPA